MTNICTDHPIDVLADGNASISQIIAAVSELDHSNDYAHTAHLGISANITLNMLDVYLRRHAYLAGTRLSVSIGGYDDLMGDIHRFRLQDIEHLFILLFFDNLLPAFEAQLTHLDADIIASKKTDIFMRLELALSNAQSFRTIHLAYFHRYSLPVLPTLENDRIDAVLRTFNTELKALATRFHNVTLFDVHTVVARVGYKQAYEQRFYARSKAPYTPQALNQIAHDLNLVTRGFGNHYYKVLVMDCDNTLWGGILGEDLASGVLLDPYSFPGNIFWRVQHEIIGLEQKGVIIGLCSKNNPEDVEELLVSHPFMVLKKNHIAIQKINWSDKVSNLKQIAMELNVGLESVVFIDDSSFECQAVSAQLPMVKVFQVPENLTDYPLLIRKLGALFLARATTGSKTQQYMQRQAAEQAKAQYNSQEEYLESLNLKVITQCDHASDAARVAELSQKSNQFNLTTRRYSEAEIRSFMDDQNTHVYTLQAHDKFGDNGLIGVVIIRFAAPAAVVDTFFMSCRVLGRGIENVIWPRVVDDARKRSCIQLNAEYIPTQKNKQVKDFFDHLGLQLTTSQDDDHRYYCASLETFLPRLSPWIKDIQHG